MTPLPTALEARAEIADLLHRYAYNMRHRRWGSFLELFTEDAEFILYEARLGHDDEAAVRTHTVGRFQTVEFICISGETMVLCPLIHNLLIELDGTKARSTCVMENRTWPTTAGRIGEYADCYRYEQGLWLFTRRSFTMFVD